ncbi:hypothetical protein [Bradyrhizobium sp. dw_78]|uniref:hypothetical protein n=1 Tax=Bradyrhizobium sp. dw_78 TaxID=2719793 RepID=UPI001BD5CE4C|nr:hypothetical protein [Bradyrhizobium sp. dw_78]
MKHEIVRRQFAKIGGAWIALEDAQQRDLDVERSWSSFCVLVSGDKLDDIARTLRERVSSSHIDIVPSAAAGGVWVLGAMYHLENALPRLAP